MSLHSLAAVLFLAGTSAFAEERPPWLSGSSAQYPKAQYIIGIGEASNQEKAADKARTEVAKAIGVEVTGKSKISTEESATKSGHAYSAHVSDEVRTSVAKVLDGVEVVQYYRDESGTHYALAVLDRNHSLDILRDKLSEFDRDFKDLSEELERAEGKFARVRVSLKLASLVISRKKMNGDYRVLNPTGKGIAAPEGMNEVLIKARKAIAALTVQVKAKGEIPESVSMRIAQNLTALGLKAVAGQLRGTPDLLVEAESSGQPLPPENLTWFWAEGKVAVKLSYGNTGELFTRFSENGQEASRDPGAAVDATLLALADRASKRVFYEVSSGKLLDD